MLYNKHMKKSLPALILAILPLLTIYVLAPLINLSTQSIILLRVGGFCVVALLFIIGLYLGKKMPAHSIIITLLLSVFFTIIFVTATFILLHVLILQEARLSASGLLAWNSLVLFPLVPAFIGYVIGRA